MLDGRERIIAWMALGRTLAPHPGVASVLYASGTRRGHRRYEDSQFHRPAAERAERTVASGVAAFGTEGLGIARAIAAELPGWPVIHHGEAARRTAADAPRWTFGYSA